MNIKKIFSLALASFLALPLSAQIMLSPCFDSSIGGLTDNNMAIVEGRLRNVISSCGAESGYGGRFVLGCKVAALQIFPISVEGKVVADIGASTGGFTDCALQNGAAKVYAIDVGYGQLAWKLRSDERVINMERTNVRYLEADSLPEQVDAATIDVAFISLDKILPAVHKILKSDGFVIALIKPQFEAGKENVGKKGVVRDAKVHEEVINNVIAFAKAEGFGIAGLDFSPIKGPEGNIEYLLHLTLGEDDAVSAEYVAELVGRSHGDLDK